MTTNNSEDDKKKKLIIPGGVWEGNENTSLVVSCKLPEIKVAELCHDSTPYAYEVLWDTLEATEDGFKASLRAMNYEEYHNRIDELTNS